MSTACLFKAKSNNMEQYLKLHLVTIASLTGKTPTTPDGNYAPNCLHFPLQEDGITAHERKWEKNVG